MRRVIPCVGLALCCAAVGCGPMTSPMPQRMPDEQQKEIDAAWDAALAPVQKHDRSTWLDVMIRAHAFQVGVDELHLRSVKKWSGGTVVMEIRIDRAAPQADQFTVTVLDRTGLELRKEAYTRDEVELAARDFEDADRDGGNRWPEKKAWVERRSERVRAILPFMPKEGAGEPAK